MEEFDEKNHHDCVLTRQECTNIFEKMLLSLDGELTHEEENQLMSQMKQYPCCVQKFEIEKSYKEFLCNKLVKKPVSPHLISSIKDKVREIGYQPRA